MIFHVMLSKYQTSFSFASVQKCPRKEISRNEVKDKNEFLVSSRFFVGRHLFRILVMIFLRLSISRKESSSLSSSFLFPLLSSVVLRTAAIRFIF